MFRLSPRPRLFFISSSLIALSVAGCGAAPSSVATPKTTTTSAKKASTAKKATTSAPDAAKVATASPVAPAAVAPPTSANALVAQVGPGATVPEPVSTLAVPTTVTPAAAPPPPPPILPAGLMAVLDAPSLSAEVTSMKNGFFLGIGTFKCTVQVRNDGDEPRTALLKVTFKNGDNDSKSPTAVKLLSIGGHGTQDLDFEDKKWTTDNVEASISATIPGQALGAFVVSKKNGVILGAGKFKCTVEVINPDEQPRTGTLVVVFRNGKKDAVTDPVRTAVSLAPHATQVFDFEDKTWSTDDVAVAVE